MRQPRRFGMAIIRGDGGVTVTGSDSGSGKATYVSTSAPKASTSSSSSSSSSSSRSTSSSSSHDHDSDSRDQERLKELERLASYDESYRNTLSYQETKRDLSQRTGSPKTFEDYAPGQTPYEQLERKEGEFYESSQRGLKNVKTADVYAPEQTKAAFSKPPEQFPEAFARATTLAQQRQAAEEWQLKQMSGLQAVKRDEYGIAQSITVQDKGKQVEYNPRTGEVYSLADEDAYADLTTGQAVYRESGAQLDPYREKDYLALKKLGLTPEIASETLGYTDWFWKDVEAQAQERGAKAMALSVVGGIGGASSATGQLASLEETEGGYVVELTDLAKQTGATQLMDNAIAGYSKTHPYAEAVKLGEGEYLIKQKAFTDPRYFASKGFGTDKLSSIGLSWEGKEPTVSFESGATKKYSELTGTQKTAFDLNYSSVLDQMVADINATALQEGFGLAGGGVRFEKSGSNITLANTEGLLSLEGWKLNAGAVLDSMPQAQKAVGFEFKKSGSGFQLFKVGDTYSAQGGIPVREDVPYSELSAEEKEIADRAMEEMTTSPDYLANVAAAQKALGTEDVGIKKTAAGYEFKNIESYSYSTAAKTAYDKEIAGYQAEAAKYPGERDLFADIQKLGAMTYDFTVNNRWLEQIPEEDVQKYKIEQGTYFETPVKWTSQRIDRNLQQWGAAASLTIAEAGHGINKGIHYVFGEDFQTPVVPVIQPLSETQAKAVDYKLAFEKQALEAQVTAGYRQFRFEESKHDAFAFAKSTPVVVGGLILGYSAVSGTGAAAAAGETVAKVSALKPLAELPTIGTMAGFGVQSAVAGVGIKEAAKTLSVPEYRPMSDIEDVKKTAAASFAAGVAYSAAYPLIASKLGYFAQDIGVVVEKGTALGGVKGALWTGGAVAKRFAVAGGAGAVAGAAYPTVEAIYEGKPIEGERVLEGAKYGAALGVTFEGLAMGMEAFPARLYLEKVNYQTVLPKEHGTPIAPVATGKVRFHGQPVPGEAAEGLAFPSRPLGEPGEYLPFNPAENYIATARIRQFVPAMEEVSHSYIGLGVGLKNQPARPLVGVKDYLQPQFGFPKLYEEGSLLVMPAQATSPLSYAIAKHEFYRYADYIQGVKASSPQLYSQLSGMAEYRYAAFKAGAADYSSALDAFYMPEGKFDLASSLQVSRQRLALGEAITKKVYFGKEIPELQVRYSEVAENYPYFAEKELGAKSGEAIQSYMKILEQNKGQTVIFGSSAKKTYMGEKMGGWSADADIMYAGAPENLATQIFQAEKPYFGSRIQIAPERQSLVNIQYGGEFHHAFDIHSKYYDSGGGTILSEYLFAGMKEKPFFVPQENLRQTSFAEETARAAGSAFGFHEFGIGVAEAHRAKDIVRFMESAGYYADYYSMPSLAALNEQLRASIGQRFFNLAAKEGSPLIVVKEPAYAAYAYTPPQALAVPAYRAPSQKVAKTAAYSYSREYGRLASRQYAPAERQYSLKTPSYDVGYKSDYKPGYKYQAPYQYEKPYAYRAPRGYRSDYGYDKPYGYKQAYSYEKPYDYGYKYDYGYGYEKPYQYQYKYDYKYPYQYRYKQPYAYNYKYDYRYEYPYQYKPPVPASLPSMLGLGNRAARMPRPTFRLMTSGERSLYADLYSVAKSELRYGRATHPSLRKRPQVWGYESRGIGKVPTVEQLERPRSRTKGVLMRQLATGKRRKWL